MEWTEGEGAKRSKEIFFNDEYDFIYLNFFLVSLPLSLSSFAIEREIHDTRVIETDIYRCVCINPLLSLPLHMYECVCMCQEKPIFQLMIIVMLLLPMLCLHDYMQRVLKFDGGMPDQIWEMIFGSCQAFNVWPLHL